MENHQAIKPEDFNECCDAVGQEAPPNPAPGEMRPPFPGREAAEDPETAEPEDRNVA
jgi:hypothetical protein